MVPISSQKETARAWLDLLLDQYDDILDLILLAAALISFLLAYFETSSSCWIQYLTTGHFVHFDVLGPALLQLVSIH